MQDPKKLYTRWKRTTKNLEHKAALERVLNVMGIYPSLGDEVALVSEHKAIVMRANGQFNTEYWQSCDIRFVNWHTGEVIS